MHYSKFTIRNYKGIKHAVIDIDKEPKIKVLTLVGLNESGKTSILEAINTFQKDISANDTYKLIPKNEKFNFNGNISIIARLKLSEKDNEKVKKFAESLGYRKIIDIPHIDVDKVYSFENSTFKNYSNLWTIVLEGIKKGATKQKKIEHNISAISDWQKIVDFIKKQMFPSILYYPNFLFDFPDRIYLDEDKLDSIEQDTYRGVIQDILYSMNANLSIETHLLKRLNTDSSSNNEALEHTLSKMSAEVSRVVFKAWAKLFRINGKEIVIKAGSTTISDKTRYYLEFKLKEGASQFYITERSLGFKWFFTFLLFTEFRKHRTTENGEILFLLDEPASNLHSTAQKNLLQTFEDIIAKSTLIYTTHSHHLIKPEWLNGAYIVRNKGLNYTDDFTFDANMTDIEALPYKEFVANYPDQRDYFQPILDTLNYQPGLLEKIESIIVTEGKNDFYTLKYLNSGYFNDLYSSINLYPGGGANANSNIIRLYVAWNRDYHILLDGDEAGRNAKILYVKEIGEIVSENIIVFSEIDSSLVGKAMEDLFSDTEKLEITKYFDSKAAKYNKSKFNSALQMAYYSKYKFTLSKETISNFKTIFNYLKAKFSRVN